MAKHLQIMYWRCRRCGRTNRLRTVVAEFEPAVYTCEHCAEDSTVQAQDLVESATRFRLNRRRPNESDAYDA